MNYCIPKIGSHVAKEANRDAQALSHFSLIAEAPEEASVKIKERRQFE
jgi:hypothetical protein